MLKKRGAKNYDNKRFGWNKDRVISSIFTIRINIPKPYRTILSVCLSKKHALWKQDNTYFLFFKQKSGTSYYWGLDIQWLFINITETHPSSILCGDKTLGGFLFSDKWSIPHSPSFHPTLMRKEGLTNYKHGNASLAGDNSPKPLKWCLNTKCGYFL